MKKSALFSSLGLLCSSLLFAHATTPPPAQLQSFEQVNDSSWYLGAAYEVVDSFSAKADNGLNLDIADTPAVLSKQGDLQHPGMGYQIFLGYTVNRYLGIEFKFEQLVSANKYQETFTFSPDLEGLSATILYKTKNIVFGPFVMIDIPISTYFIPYFKGGFCTYYTTTTSDSTSTLEGAFPGYTRKWNEKFVYGMGIKFQVARYFGLRIEYETASERWRRDYTKGNLSAGGYFGYSF